MCNKTIAKKKFTNPRSVSYLVSQKALEKSYYRSYLGPNIEKWFAEELYNIALLYADVSIFSFIFLSKIVNILESAKLANAIFVSGLLLMMKKFQLSKNVGITTISQVNIAITLENICILNYN